MDPNGHSPGVLQFGGFSLDLSNRELRKGGAPVKLQSQQLQLLALLAGRPGVIVSREEIRRALWDDQTFVDFDQSINFCVNRVRDALGDDPQSPRYIETVPRKGYRFIAPASQSPNGVEQQPPPALQPVRHTRRWWPLAATAVLAVAAIALAAKFIPPRLPEKPIQSLAVLPLENLSHDPDQDYFADGMTDELITDLAKISALRVISRTSVMQYKGTRKPVPQIARELNVDAVLEGTVMRDRGRVRITAQLIAAQPEKHLWAEKYEGSLTEVLTLQDAVAKAVVNEIQVKLTPREQAGLAAPRAVNPAAYESYLRGLALDPTEENLQKSLAYFQHAIDIDPGYASAWAELSVYYELLAAYGVLPPSDAYPRARAAADKALQLDNTRVAAISTLGVLKAKDWDWAGADYEFKRALELKPNDQLVHMEYSGVLAMIGRTGEALEHARRARELGPLNYWADVQLTFRNYLARRYGEAAAESPKLIEWEPQLSWGYICQASVYLQTGRPREAVADLRKAVDVSHRGVFELMYLGHALGISGARAESEKVLTEMRGLMSHRYVPPEFIAVVYVGLADRDQAIQWFEKAFAQHTIHSWVLPDPRLDPVRSDPRFKRLLERMGLSR
jgi:TolB-like protein/DNA-binding winged helix-turn-helix (wHTH) protein